MTTNFIFPFEGKTCSRVQTTPPVQPLMIYNNMKTTIVNIEGNNGPEQIDWRSEE